MKKKTLLTVTVDLGDIWTDDEELSDALRRAIKDSVIREVWGKIANEVQSKITDRVKQSVDESMNKKINDYIADIVKTETVSYNQKTVTIAEYVKMYFNDKSAYNNANDVIKRLADNFGQEMKNRYDLLFASQLVAKMSNAGLLKEDVAKMLLPSIPK